MNKRLLAIGALNFVDVLSFALFIPVFPFIVEKYGGTITAYGILLAIYPIFQFIGAPILGTLSDVYGRRPILMISQAGTLLSWIIFGAAYFVPNIYLGPFSLPLTIIGFSRMVDGLTGGNMSVANAYLTDITESGEKTKVFGLLASVSGFGLVIGPVIGGAADSAGLGYLGPVIIAFFLSLCAITAMYFYLPETLLRKDREKNLNFELKNELNIFAKIRKLGSTFLQKMYFLRIFFACAFTGYTAIVVLLIINRFNLTSNQVGVLFLLNGIFFILNQTFLAKLISDRFGNLNAFYIGHLAMATGLLLTPLANTVLIFIVFTYLVNIGYSLSFPIFRTIITDIVDRSKQGVVIGIDESIVAGASAIGPIIASSLFENTGAWTYVLLSLLLVVPHIFFYFVTGKFLVRVPKR